MLGVQAGERAALSALYERTHAAVYGFALSICRNAADAEDVMQETFVRAFTAADRYRPQGKPMAWLLTITKNLANGRLRARGRSAGPIPETERLPATGLSPEDRLTLPSLLKALSSEQRQIVTLHAVSGLKHREIAALLDLPLSTVLSKYNRAVIKLRLLWKEEDGP